MPLIKSNAPLSDILEWKNKPKMTFCYKNLFKVMNNNGNLIMSCILEKVFLNNNASSTQIAFVIAICTTLLDPQCKEINVKENMMRCKVNHYKVGFCNFILVFNLL